MTGFRLESDSGLASWLNRFKQVSTDPAKLNPYISQAMRDGGEFNGRAIIGVAAYIQNNARNRHATAKGLGAEPTNFYAGAAEDIELINRGSLAGLRFTRGAAIFSHWLNDITITPTGDHKWLAIPAMAIAYGKRPGWFGGGLQFQPRGKNFAVLVFRKVGFQKMHEAPTEADALQKALKPTRPAKAATAATAKKPAIAQSINHQPTSADSQKAVFKLVKNARLKADPTLLPPQQDIYDLAKIGVARALENEANQPPIV